MPLHDADCGSGDGGLGRGMSRIPPTTAERATIALVAHDHKKAELVDFVSRHRDVLRHFGLFATGTTGQRIIECCPDLAVTRLKSGPLGGDQQIGALIAEGRITALFFFVDPLSPHPHDVDVKALMRVSLVYDIPMALNRATAERLIKTFAEERRTAAFS
jgi:methylglyoxal synthase